MKIKGIGKRFIFAAMAAAAISMPAVHLTAPLSVYAEETAEEPVPKLQGEYTDRNTPGAKIVISQNEDQSYTVSITGPAGEDGKIPSWGFTGTFDPNTKSIHYNDCVKMTHIEGLASAAIVYGNGTGSVIYKDGVLFWNSDNDPELTDAIWDKTPGTTDYDITSVVYPCKDGEEHGSVSLDKTTGRGGTDVNVTVTPDEGHVVSKVYVTTRMSGYKTEVEVTEAGENTFTFTLPEDDVQVAVAIEEENADPEQTDLSGDWLDREKKQAAMKLYKNSDGTYHAVIDMPDEGDKMFRWEFSGKYDPTLKNIRYSDEKKFSYQRDNFSGTYEMIYENGTGSLVNKDGTLFWNSDGFPASQDMIFERTKDIEFTVTASVAKDETDGKAHGTVKMDKDLANPGVTVTATITPDAGYEVSGFSVGYDGDDQGVEVTKTSDTTYTFTMPAADVEATAYVSAKQSEIPDIEGAWANREDSKNLMFINKNESGTYDVRIAKFASDGDPEIWEFTGTYDSENKRLGFESSKKLKVTIDENGNPVTVSEEDAPGGALIYKDGIFFLNINGAPDDWEPIQFEKLDKSYEIKTSSSDNGKVTANKMNAYPGEPVIIKTEPAKGFATHRVNVLDKDGKEVDVKKLGTDTYAFLMPESDVDISATFVDSGDGGAATVPTDQTNGTSGSSSGYRGGSGSVTSAVANTGDTNLLPLWISIAAASAGAAVTLIAIKRKRG